jgi:hypothetical protein
MEPVDGKVANEVIGQTRLNWRLGTSVMWRKAENDDRLRR